jgi:O-antigen/teichoic acid export membrane protein
MTVPALLKSLPVLSVMTLLGRSSTLISLIVFTPLYISYLGHEGFGVIGIYYIVLGAIGIVDGALSSTFLRYTAAYSRDGENSNKLRQSFEVVYLVYALLLISLAFSAYIFLGSFDLLTSGEGAIWSIDIYMIFVLAAVSQIACNFYYSGLIGNQRVAQANFLQFLFVLIRTGGIFVVAPVDGVNLRTIFFWYSFVNLLFILIFRFFLIRCSPIVPSAPRSTDLAFVKNTFPYFVSMLGMAIISFTLGYLDRALLVIQIPLDLYGRWVALLPLTTLPTLMVTAVGYAFMPQMTDMIQQGTHNNIKGLYIKSLVVGVSLSLTVAILASKYFDQVIFIWIGSSELYSSLQVAFFVQMASSIVQAATVIPFYFSLAVGRPLKSLKIGLAASVLNLVLLTLVIPKYGVLGASIVSLFVGLVSLPFNIAMLHGNPMNINLFSSFRRGILMSVGFGALLFILIYNVDIPQISRTSVLLQLLLVGLASFGGWALFIFTAYKALDPIECHK